MSEAHVSSSSGATPNGEPRTRDSVPRTAADLVGIALIAPLGSPEPGEPDEAVRALQALLRHALHS